MNTILVVVLLTISVVVGVAAVSSFVAADDTTELESGTANTIIGPDKIDEVANEPNAGEGDTLPQKNESDAEDNKSGSDTESVEHTIDPSAYADSPPADVVATDDAEPTFVSGWFDGIIGDDERDQVTTPIDEHPEVAALYVDFGPEDSACSGTMVSEYHLLTAGHCVYDNGDPFPWSAGHGWAERIYALPATDEFSMPYDGARVTNMRTYSGWIDDEQRRQDIALVTLDRPLGEHTGTKSIFSTDNTDHWRYETVVTGVGYPASPPDEVWPTMLEDDGVGGGTSHARYPFVDSIHPFAVDVTAGQSGGPVLHNDEIVSVIAWNEPEVSSYNFGPRITNDRHDDFQNWMASDSTPDDTAFPSFFAPAWADIDEPSNEVEDEMASLEDTVEITTTVYNVGTSTDDGSFEISYHLSENEEFTHADSQLLDIVDHELPDPFTADDITADVPVDAADTGSYYLHARIHGSTDFDRPIAVEMDRGPGQFVDNSRIINEHNVDEIELVAPADFDVEITDTNSPVEAGETLAVAAEIENEGDVSDTQTVDLDVSGLGTDSESVQLDGGSDTTETFEVSTRSNDAGDYTAEIESEDDSDSTSVEVEELALFAVEITDTNSPVEEGETLEVTAEIENKGDVSDTQTIDIDILGLAIGDYSTTVTLDGSGTQTETFSIPTISGDSGDYTAEVESEDDSDSSPVRINSPVSFAMEIADTNSPVEVGDELEATIQVENEGDVSGTQVVELFVPGLGTDSRSVSVDGGDKQTEIFSISTGSGDADNYTAAVRGEDGQNRDTIPIRVDEPGVFGVEITDTNSPVEAGETLEVTAEIENEGDVSDTQTVDLDVSGLGTDSESVQLDGSSDTTETFEVSTGSNEAGDYTAEVESEDDSTTAPVTVQADEDDPFFAVEITGTNSPVEEGEDLEVTAEIENQGDISDTQTVDFTVEEGFDTLGSDSSSISLDGSDSQTETFSVSTTAGDAGDYTAEVASADDPDTTDIEIDEADTSEGAVDSVLHPSTIGQDETFSIDITTDASAATVVDFELDGFAVDLTSDDAVQITDARVEFVDPTAGPSTYTIDVDVSESAPGDTGTISVWVNSDAEASADDSTVSTFKIDDGHASGVSQTVWNTVTDQNHPTDELTLQDLIDSIQAYQDSGALAGAEVSLQDLIDLIQWYQANGADTASATSILTEGGTNAEVSAENQTTSPDDGAITNLDHPESVPDDGQFDVTVETANSAGTVVEFDTDDTTIDVSSEDAVQIVENRVEFLDTSAGDSAYTITVDVSDTDTDGEIDIATWVNAELREDADDEATGTVAIDGATDPGFIAGDVIDTDGNTLSGVEIEFTNTETEGTRTTTSGDTGAYVVELQPGPYEIRVDEPGFEEFFGSPLLVEAGQTPNVDVQLEPVDTPTNPGIITGDVADIDGNILSGVEVEATNIETAQATTTTANSEGEYEFEVPPGTYEIRVEEPGYLPFDSAPVEIEEEQLEIVPVRLEPQVEPASIEGQVVDANDDAIPGAEIEVIAAEDGTTVTELVADSEGEFLISDLRAETTYELIATLDSAGDERTGSTTIETEAGTNTATLVVPPETTETVSYQSGDITSVVTDTNDDPVDARLFVDQLVDDDANIAINFEPDDVQELESFTATVTDDDGDVIETVDLTAAEMRNFAFQGFDSQLELAEGEDEFELLTDRFVDQPTLSPVPAVDADEGVSLSLTGVSRTGDIGQSVLTPVEVDRTSTTSIVIPRDGPDPVPFEVEVLLKEFSIEAGDTLTVETVVSNPEEGALDAQLIEFGLETPDTTYTRTRTVSLASGESTTEVVSFSTDVEDAGAAEVYAASETDTDTASGTITEPDDSDSPASFDISSVETSTPAAPGDTLVIQTDIQNTGDLSDTKRVEAIIPDLGRTSKLVSLAGGDSTAVELSVPTDAGDNGEYELVIETPDDVEEVPITIESDTSPVAEYTNDQGIVESDGLQRAFSDWQAGLIESDLLQEVFTAWQSGNPVE